LWIQVRRPGVRDRLVLLGDPAAAQTGASDDREVVPGSGEIGKIATAANIPIGDYAAIEADGTVVLLGRGPSGINSAGKKIFPEEVEEAVKCHPDVLDCLVVGVADKKSGQCVVAVVECTGEDHASDESTLEEANRIRGQGAAGRQWQGGLQVGAAGCRAGCRLSGGSRGSRLLICI